MGPLRPNHPSAAVADYLAANERVVLEMKQHWARILPPILSCLTGLVLAMAAGLMAPAWMGVVANAAWWIWLVLVGHLLYRIYEWYDETFVITNKRLVLVHGIVVKKVAMMPLSKVTDMSYNRSPLARILGYGTFVLESAGQDQALDQINYVRHPDARYREICALIFGEDDEGPHRHHSEFPYDDEAPYDADDYGWEGSPRAWRGRQHDPADETDPYGMVTEQSPISPIDPWPTYGEPHPVGETTKTLDDDSAWSVSREHATTPQTVRRSRYSDHSSEWRD